MKTKQFAALLLVLVVTISAGAAEIPGMNIVALKGSKTLVTAVTDPHVAAEITIENDAGEIIYYRKTKASPQFKFIFNLSKLSDGRYTFYLHSGKLHARREIKIQNGQVEVVQVVPEMPPFFSCEGDILHLSYLNFGKKNVSVAIYKGSKLIQTSELGNQFTINHAFDVSRMVKGDFDFILFGPDQTYSYRISR